MSAQTDNEEQSFPDIKIPIVIAIIIGICIASAVIIFEVGTDRFSAVYINPDTYSNYPETRNISFVYGINSYEQEKTSYTIYFKVGETLVDTKQIELNPKEQYEERKVIQLPDDVVYPVIISVEYISPYETNKVFFRVQNRSAIK